MQNIADLRKYLGPVKDAQIIDTIGFDTLTPQQVFIKREVSIVFADGNRAPFANPEYLEFDNNPTGRKNLAASGIDQKFIDATMTVWGDKPTVADPVSADE